MNINNSAPAFVCHDVYGNKVDSTQFEKKYDYVLLVFLRYSGCPWCNLAVHRLALEYDNLAKHNCQVVAFIQSDESKIKDNVYARQDPKPNFPIVADKAMTIYKKYGVDPSIAGTLKLIKDVPFWLSAVYKHGFKNKAIDGNLFVVPGWFLVNTHTNRIVQKGLAESFYEHESFIQIYDTLTFRD